MDSLHDRARAAMAMQGQPTGFAKVDHSKAPKRCCCHIQDDEVGRRKFPEVPSLQECPGFSADDEWQGQQWCRHCSHAEACHAEQPEVQRPGPEDDGEHDGALAAGLCPRCGGSGVDPEPVAVCCERPWPGGECCGSPEPAPQPCRSCGGAHG